MATDKQKAGPQNRVLVICRKKLDVLHHLHASDERLLTISLTEKVLSLTS